MPIKQYKISKGEIEMRIILSLLIAALLIGAGFLIACNFTENPNDVVTTTTGEPEHVHSFTVTVVNPTCVSQGYTRHTCECGYEMCDNVLDIAPDVHYWEITNVVDATCTAVGTKSYECSLCAETKVEELAIIAHTITNWATVTPATCLEDGEDERHCEYCDYAETKVVKALNHDWDDGVVTDPSCTASGKTFYTCERCAETRTEVIEKLPHSFGDEWNTTVEPTCVEIGQEVRSCSVCDFVETREVAALGHNLSDWTIYTAPSCVSLGEERKTCSRCDYYESREVAMLDHEWNLGEIIPASCLEAGCVLYTCGTCTEKRTEVTQPATGHTLAGWTTYTESTCESVGEERNVCEDCDYYESRNLPLADHTWDEGVVTEPTCLKDGFTTYTCTACGDKKVEAGAAATGHTLGEWETYTDATCIAKGVERQYCSNGCGYFESRETAITGHNLGDWTVRTPATCTETGVEYRACQNAGCNYEVTRSIAATGHALGEWFNVTSSTCETLGEDRKDCDNCDYFETREVPMHNYVTTVVDPTCTTHGYTETVCTGTCGYHTITYTNPTGHAWGDWTEEEHYDSRECVKCGAEDVKNRD